MRIPAAVVVAVTVGSLGTTSCLELDRVDDLGPGDIRLTVERDGAPVDDAVVRALSTRVTASRQGKATLRALPVGQWPLVVSVDDDNDGVADAAAIDARPVVTDVGTAVTSDFTGFDLGVVALEPTGSLAGTAPLCAAEELCRVVVVRTVTDGDGTTLTLPVEASTGVGVDGTWRIDGLPAGPVSVVAFAWDRSALPPLVAATRPTRFGVVEATVGDDVVVAVVDTPATSTSSTIAFRAAVDVLERAAGEANFFVPTSTTTATADGASSSVGPLSADTATASVQVPPGLLDLRVQLDTGVGALFNVVVVPNGAPLVPLAIGTSTCSAVDRGVDCNGDGKNDARDVDASGTIDLADVDLDHNGVADSADTDLDHDGVADSTEPTACRVPGLGADRDADCLCDLVDPFPDCAGNDPLACDVAVPAVCE